MNNQDLKFIRSATIEDNLGESTKNFSLYKYDSCGHSKFIYKGKVKNGYPLCQECVRERINAEAKEAGLTLVDKGTKNKDSKLYKFNTCGHFQEISVLHVRKKTFECKSCLDEQYEIEATKAGLTILNLEDKKNAERLYKINKCGHIRKLKLTWVREQTFHCVECQDAKIRKEAEKVNLEYLRRATSEDMKTEPKSHAIYKSLVCGHTLCLSKTVVRNGIFKCPICKEGYDSRESTIYLYKIKVRDFEWLKLGFSSNPLERLRQYKLDEGFEYSLVFSLKIDTGKSALGLERALHSKLKSKRLCPKLMKNYMEKSGFTECYPAHMEAEITKQMEAMLDG